MSDELAAASAAQSKRRRGHWAIVATLLAALALVAAGCGDDGDDGATGGSGDITATQTEDAGADGVATARERVEAASEPVEFSFDQPLANASEGKGKRFFFFSPVENIPFVESMLQGVKDGAAFAGVRGDFAESGGDPVKGARLISDAVKSGKYDAIVTSSFPVDLIANPLREAKKAGIPVIAQFTDDPKLPTPEGEELGIYGEVSYDFTEIGELLAAYAVADSDGNAGAALITSSDSVTSALSAEGMDEVFASLCPDCTFEERDVLIADWATRLGPVSASLLQDPNIDYLIPIYDAMATFVIPEVKRVGRDVTVLTGGSGKPQLEEMQGGNSALGQLGQPAYWAGWATFDQVLRALVGADPVEDENIPLRLFSPANIDSVDLDAPEQSWYGDVDLEAEYGALWGL